MKIRRLLGTIILAVALMLGVIGPSSGDKAKAATPTLKIFNGEKIWYTPGFKIKKFSAKGGKVKLSRKNSSTIYIKGVKKGTSTVTVRGGGRAKTIRVSVKNPTFVGKVASVSKSGSSYKVTFEIQNTSGIYCNRITIPYVLTDRSGNSVSNGTLYLYRAIPRKKLYYTVTGYSSYSTIAGGYLKDAGSYLYHYTAVKNSNITKKVKMTQKSKSSTRLKLKMKNNAGKFAFGAVDVIYYNGSGKMISAETKLYGLTSRGRSGSSKTLTFSIPSGTKKIKKINRAYTETNIRL